MSKEIHSIDISKEALAHVRLVILDLTPATAPNLNYGLGCELFRSGHSVTVATGFPRYNLKNTPVKYLGKIYMRETMDGMTVVRFWYPALPRNIPVARGIDTFLMASALVLSALRAGKQDVASVFSPPLAVGLTAVLMGKLYGYPFIYNVHDLFPQNGIDLGVLRNKALIRQTVKILREYTDRIAIVETDGGCGAWQSEEAFAGHGMYELLGEFGVEIVNLNDEPSEMITFRSGRQTHGVPLPTRLLHEMDLFITMPVPKIHCMTGLTLSYKNQWEDKE